MAASTPSKSNSRMAMSEINVTPFVDVMLVLLIIFMVTAPMMQQGLDVNLPKTASTGVSLNEDPFILVVDATGRIKAGDSAIQRDDLRTKIKAIFDTRRSKQIYIQADEKVDYGVVAYVMGEIRQAGITNISLITLPKE
ncbi:MAG: adventurous gliding motility protein [Pseudobdellovibrio sp.]|jgi:biopolymer transport protein TolR|nr:adventurous gliding motility protein [Pseudobdellovibrio sp.]